MNRALVNGGLVARSSQPSLPRVAAFWTTKRQGLPERFEVGTGFIQGFDLRSEVVRRHFFHAQEQLSKSGTHDLIAVFPQFVEQAALVAGVEFDVFSEVGHEVAPNDGQRVVNQLAKAVRPLFLVEVFHVANGRTCSGQHAFVIGL